MAVRLPDPPGLSHLYRHQRNLGASYRPHLPTCTSPVTSTASLPARLARPALLPSSLACSIPPIVQVQQQQPSVAMASAMATAQVSRVVTAPLATAQKSSFFAGSSSVSMLGCSNGARVSMAEWLPGLPRPDYLDGSAPGDFGFDPLGLGAVPENLERFKESELIHARWAMMAVPGVLIPEIFGYGNWVTAQKWAAVPDGQATYLGNPVPWGTLPFILAVEFFALAFAESQRNGEPDPEKRKYPGGPFDPLGFSKGRSFEQMKLREIKNGRLALVAFLGFVIQAVAYPGTGPLENLKTHLADPWHHTIAQVIIPRSVV